MTSCPIRHASSPYARKKPAIQMHILKLESETKRAYKTTSRTARRRGRVETMREPRFLRCLCAGILGYMDENGKRLHTILLLESFQG